MRLILMKMNRLLVVMAGIALAMPGVVAPLSAQRSAPPGKGSTFKDTSMIKPPPGAKVALFEFEDLECPMCRTVHPIVLGAIEHYNIAFIRKDFPLVQIHIWSTDAAIWARYMQDKISPKIAADYRTAVFAAQPSIASKDDLTNFTRKFFQEHGGQMPFVVDPTGQFRKEVFEDKALGDKIGINQTPTIFVCTQHQWVQVVEPTLLYQTIDQMEAEAKAGR